MSDTDSSNYQKVKEAVLKSYKLVPEAYRVKFRNFKKDHNMTYMEFARTKEHCFEEWCDARHINSLEDLKQLILLEDFESNVPAEIRLHIEDCQALTLSEAAELADTYALTHHLGSRFSSQSMGMFHSMQGAQKSFGFRSWKQGAASNKGGNSGYHKGSAQPECFFCGKKGHLIKQCFKLQAQREAEKKKPVALLQASGRPDTEQKES